jgi:cytidylate kinase
MFISGGTKMVSYEAIVESHIKRWVTGRRLAAQVLQERERQAYFFPLPPPITISFAYGCGAREIADNLSRHLGYQLFDREIIEIISKDSKAQLRIIEALDEGDRKRIATLTDQLFSRRVITHESYRRALVRVVHSLSLLGPAVFIGRGACHILRETGAFNLRIIASFADRIKRLMERERIDEEEAQKKIEYQDAMKKGFIRTHFNREIDDPRWYHLTLNTSCIPPRTAVNVILSLYSELVRTQVSEGREKGDVSLSRDQGGGIPVKP